MYRTMMLAAGVVAAISGHVMAFEVDSEAVKALEAKITEAYKADRAMVVTSEVSIELGGQKDQESVTTRFGADGAKEIVTPNFDVVALDGYFYMTIRGVDDFYLRRPLGDGVAKTMSDVFMTADVVPWVISLRGGDPPASWISQMTFGLFPEATVTGVSTATREVDGVPMDVDVLELTSARGAGALEVSSETGLIQTLKAAVSSPNGPAEIQATLNVTVETKTMDSLKPAIAFEAGDRKMVESLEDMLPQPEPEPASKLAPDFTLPQLDGLEVSLSELRGKIVVLDFWATWCGPCKRGLPLVQKFADWAEANHADDIVVYAVNVWERGSSQSAIDQMVEAFWTKNKFTMPTLISYSRKITQDYGVTGIPVTVMIDRDGKVAKQHRGYSPALFDQLKAEAETLLNAKP